MPALTPEMIAACGPAAKKYGVSENIHPDDLLFWSTGANIDGYFESGHLAALFIKDVLGKWSGLPRPFSFLDFASGYGRVTRHMKHVIPDAVVTASDIHPAAVEFVRSIGISAVLSSRVPEEFNPGQAFDVICVISFFTHLPRETWGRWLRCISRFLKPGGILVFTTHGRASVPIPAMKAMSITMESVPADGFLYLPVSDQADLSLYDYGTAITLFEFVFHETLEAGLRIVWFQEAAVGYQDLVVVTRGDSNATSFRKALKKGSLRLRNPFRKRTATEAV
jgi:SAM-dependent methyltransferase